jgi:hypothetical protein
MHFRPLHDRVLVRRIDAEEKTAGGIIIPDSAKEKPQDGEISFGHFEKRTGLGNHGLVLGQKFPVSYLKRKGDLLVFCLPRQAVRAPSGPGGDGRRRCPTPARTHLAPWRIWL